MSGLEGGGSGRLRGKSLERQRREAQERAARDAAVGEEKTPAAASGSSPESRLKGRGLRLSAPEGARTAEPVPGTLRRGALDRKPEAVDSAKIPVLTSDLVFGAEGGGVGELELDGFAARISNHVSGQDAMAISADKNVFVVADGLGGTAGSHKVREVAKWSRAVAEMVARSSDIHDLADDKRFQELLAGVKSDLEVAGVDLTTGSRLSGMRRGIKTTISAAQRVSPDTFNIFAIGDSPIYLIDKASGAIIKQFGEDALRGMTDAPLRNTAGLDPGGNVIGIQDDAYIVKETIKVLPGTYLVIASDFFSDLTAQKKGTLLDYSGLSTEAFHSKATASDIAKVDDATLIVIDPERLPIFEESDRDV